MTDSFTVRTTPEQRAFAYLFEPDQFGKYTCLIREDVFEGELYRLIGVDTRKQLGGSDQFWIKAQNRQPFEIRLDDLVTEAVWLHHWQLWQSLRRPMPLGDLSFELTPWQIPFSAGHRYAGNYMLFINSATVHTLIETREDA